MITQAPVISAADAARYHADGFIIVRKVFSADRIALVVAEAERLRQRTDLIDTDNIRCRWQDDVTRSEWRLTPGFACVDTVIPHRSR